MKAPSIRRHAPFIGLLALALLGGACGSTEPAPPVTVAIAPDSVGMVQGETRVLAVTVAGSETHGVLWSSTAPSVASVSQAGMVSALSAGSATIVATSIADASRSGTAKVTVRPPVAVTVAPFTVAIEAGATQQLTATVTGSANTAVTWSSSAPSIATVDGAGLVRGVAAGSATVTATSVADPTKSASAVVTVRPPVVVTLNSASVAIEVGQGQQLAATVTGTPNMAVSWTSSAPGIATVDASGIVRGVAVGTATVTATSAADPSRSASAQVTVRAQSCSFSVTPHEVSLVAGNPYPIVVSNPRGTPCTIAWSSSAPSIATVEDRGYGYVVAVSPGVAIIRATDASGAADSTIVTVLAAPIVVSPSSATIPIGATQQFSATGTGASSATWTSAAPGVASVDQAGKVTAIAAGTTTITATVGDRSGSATLTVTNPAATGYRVLLSASNAPAGSPLTATAYLTDASGNVIAEAGRTVTWSTTQPGGSFAPATSATGSDGSASTTYTAGASSGAFTVRATDAAGLTGAATLTVFVPAAPTATIEPTAISFAEPQTYVTLRGTVTPNGLATQAWFEYSTSPTFATVTATRKQAVGGGTTPVALAQQTCPGFCTVPAPPGGQTLYVRVAAENSAGITRSSARAEAPPAAPTVASASLDANYAITVSWTHDGQRLDAVSRFLVRRRDLADNSGTGWVSIYSAVYSPNLPGGNAIPPSERSVLDDNFDVSRDHTWLYEVAACNYWGCSAPVTTQLATPRLPAPTNLRAAATSGSATLAWDDNSTGEKGFRVERRASGTTDWVVAAEVGANVTTASVPLPPAGVTYIYRVRATVLGNTYPSSSTARGDRLSDASNEVIVLPPA